MNQGIDPDPFPTEQPRRLELDRGRHSPCARSSSLARCHRSSVGSLARISDDAAAAAADN